MLIILLLNSIYTLFALLLSPVSIPSMPEDAITLAGNIGEYISMGTGILSVYTDLGYLISLFSLVLIVDGIIMIYRLVMWVIRKIPLINVS